MKFPLYILYLYMFYLLCNTTLKKELICSKCKKPTNNQGVRFLTGQPLPHKPPSIAFADLGIHH